MSASFSNNLRLSSSLKMEEEAKVSENQGIVSILGPDCERGKASSLRRTLSADMSSKKWLAQHGFSSTSPMKKTASSQQFLFSIADSSSSFSSSSEGEEDYEERNEEVEKQLEQFNIWSSIQTEENKKEKEKAGGQFDLWSSFLSQKANENLSKSMPDLPLPYIHPLVKKSASALSEKSLQICTESLGSETGSEGFSSSPPSEIGEIEDDKEEEVEEEQEKVCTQAFDKEELVVVKYNKKSPPKSFPPPLPSLSHHDGTASLHMRPHRKNGRLVLEAVSIPSQNYFRSQRQGGRLLLTFLNTPTNIDEIVEEEKEYKEQVFDEEFENNEEEEEEEEEAEAAAEEEEDDQNVVISEELAPKLASEVMNVHRPELMMNKLIRLANTNPTWSCKFNEAVTFEEMEEEEEEATTPLPQSLPPQARVIGKLIPSPSAATAAASFNAYDYCWRRTKPTAMTAVLNNPLTQQPPPFKKNNSNSCSNNNSMFIVSKNQKADDQQQTDDQQQQLVVLKGGNKADYFVPLLRGCKETRRSLLFWEPYCVATS